MQIFWHGQSCFKIQTNQATIIVDPFDKSTGLKVPRLSGDLVLVTHDHSDHNNISAVSGQPYLIKSPGEYETKGVFIYGIPAWHDEKGGSERGASIIYLIEADGLNLVHLGDFGQESLTNEQLEALEKVDILMIPVGGVYTIDAKKAVSIINLLEPRIVIPMHYKLPGLVYKLDPVDKFIKEIGLSVETPQEKFKISQKELPSEETKVVILKV